MILRIVVVIPSERFKVYTVNDNNEFINPGNGTVGADFTGIVEPFKNSDRL